MFGRTALLSPLAVRKQLLLAESELNRALLVEDACILTAGFHGLTLRARSFSAIASAAALVLASWAVVRRGHCDRAGVKHSWWQAVLKGAGTVSSLWLALSRRTHEPAGRESSPRR
jgi:hypothetical protein